MPAPSKMAIATSAVTRLLKEEASYHKELEQQQARIAKLDKDSTEENAEFQMKQEHRALEETKAVFPALRQRIMAAAAQLEQQLNEDGHAATPDERSKAQEALTQAKSLKD